MHDKKAYFFIGFLALVTIGFFWEVIFLGEAIVDPNVIYLYEPWRTYSNGRKAEAIATDIPFEFLSFEYFNAMSLRLGEIPLWNPYVFSGYPHLANSLSAVFYPPQLLLLFLSPLTVHNVTVIIQFFLAGLFMFLFCREIKINSFAASIGALVFMLGGFNIAWLGWRTFVGAGLWLPLILLFLERFFREGGIRNILFAGVFLGVSFLAGMVQISVYVLLASILFIVYRIYNSFGKKGFQGLKTAIPYSALFIIIGRSLAAIQLIPTFELSQQSQRVSWDFQELSFIPGKNLLTSIMPAFFDDLSKGLFTGGLKWHGGFFTAVDGHMYVGIISLFLVAFALVFSGNKHKNFFAYMGLLVLLLVFGSRVYLLFFYAVPVLQRFGPARIIFLLNFCLSVLSAMGAVVVMDGAFKKSVFFKPFLKILRLSYIIAFAILKQNIMIFLVSIFIIEFLLMKKTGKTVVWLVITSVILLDLVPVAQSFYPTGDPSQLFPKTGSLEFLENNCGMSDCRILEIEDTMPSNSNVFFGLQSVRGYDSMYPGRYCRLVNEYCPKEGEVPIRPVNWIHVSKTYDLPLFDLLNVRYIVSDKPVGATEEVSYSSKNINANETLILDLSGKSPATFVQLVSNIGPRFPWGIRQGEEIGKLILVGDKGVEYMYPILAGIDSSAVNHDKPSMNARMMHENARIIKSVKVDDFDGQRAWFTHHYFTEYQLPEHVVPVKIKLTYTHSLGRLTIQKIILKYSSGQYSEVKSEDMKIYENKNALPRAFILGRIKIIENETLLVETMRNRDFDPLQAVILEREQEFINNDASGTASITEYSSKKVKVNVKLNDTGFLVLSDQYYPGWKAYVDGEEQDILRAYYVLRAVRLAAGSHEVIFEYNPLSYKLGLMITSATLVLITIFFLLILLRRTSRRKY